MPSRLGRIVSVGIGGVALGLTLLASAPAFAVKSLPPLKIVAAENFYGDIAEQIGGAGVAVTSILSNPNQDPHQFEASPSTARALADATIVIYNGADYDPWVPKLLDVSPRAKRVVIVAADRMGAKPGDNPHIWYDPETMPAVAKAVAADLERIDSAHATDYAKRLERFLRSMKPIDRKIAAIREKHAGTLVAATEPVFGAMAAALGLTVRSTRLQYAVMNGTEPAAEDIAELEADLRAKRVKTLFHNSQVTDALTRRLLAIAKEAGVPIVGVAETEPPGRTYQEWMMETLDAVAAALGGQS